MIVGLDQIRMARASDLYAFLTTAHPDMFSRCGKSIRLKSNPSLYIRQGFYGYKDFATDETGNGIDFLTLHLGYSFQEAVLALAGAEPCGGRTPPQPHGPASAPFDVPVPASRPHSRVFAYLAGRGIPARTIRSLMSEGLLYQEAATGNAVFINRERDYCEIRGTYTLSNRPFHSCRKTCRDKFWYLKAGSEKTETVFITEAAIDAISLFILHSRTRDVSRSVYASIGGVSNYATIDRIRRHSHAVLAVDNDSAGEICRNRYRDLESVLPKNKDWNEDLMEVETRR